MVREAKRRRLAAKGWKVGDAQDFLDLTEQESAYIDLRLKLAEGLKARRIERRMTQIDLAKAVQSSQSRVAKMEAGDPSVSLDLLVKSLLALGASARELAKIISSPTTASASR
jgi:DNA-binding XRE family transcriptional regulator